MGSIKKKIRRSNGMISILIFVFIFLLVMCVQIIRLKRQEANYAKQEALLQEQYEQETQREQDLAELEEHMKTIEYIEEMAKSKLGLVYDNEIIYKEKK